MLRVVLLLLIATVSLSGCVSSATLGISETEWQSYNSDQRKNLINGYFENLNSAPDSGAVDDNSSVEVKVSGGRVNMPPFTDAFAYEPVEFQLSSGDCQNIPLKQIGDSKTVDMRVCYRKRTLYIDPSRYDVAKKVGSISLHASPIWTRGFTYRNVSSTGYVHLTNATVWVRMHTFDDSDAE